MNITIRRRFLATLTALTVAATLCGCKAKSEDAVSTAAMAAPAPGKTRVGDIAITVSNGLGKVTSAADGTSKRTVIVFEETHTSRLGQIDIAQMLVRLHDQHGLRKVSLEGAIFDDGVLPTKWFHDVTASPAAKAVGDDAAVFLLKEGEINAAEFIALVLPDVEVRGNEKAAEYALHLSDSASGSSGRYLLGIAEKSLTQEQIVEANRLIVAKKEKEALEHILESDPWVRERYRKLSNRNAIMSAEEMTALFREIEAKAGEVNAAVSDEMREGLTESIRFFEMASLRSKTMVDYTLGIAGDGGAAPVAMIIGAAHTEKVARLLKEGGASYAVISPNGIGADAPGQLAMQAYNRKNELQSVDGAAMLGSYLDGRRKPPPVLAKQWFRSKSEIYLASVLLARAAAGGGEPPFDSLSKELGSLQSIRIDPDSYAIVDDNGRRRVIFKATARIDDDDPSQTVDIWTGSWKEPPAPPRDGGVVDPGEEAPRRRPLEELLQEARNELQQAQQDGTPPATGAVVLLDISKDTKAVFATAREGVTQTAI